MHVTTMYAVKGKKGQLYPVPFSPLRRNAPGKRVLCQQHLLFKAHNGRFQTLLNNRFLRRERAALFIV